MTFTTTDALIEALEQAGVVAFRFWTRPALRFDYVSPHASTLIGIDVAQVLARPEVLLEIVHPDDHATLAAALADDSMHPDPVTVRWRHASGRVVWTEGHRFPVRDAQGRVGFVGVGFDVTERVGDGVLEQPLLNAIALRALSERLEAAREEERTRIARELHDELGQLLTGTKLDFAATIRRLQELRVPRDVVDRLQAAIGQVDIGIAMVRRIATDLRPPGLDHRDLGAALEHEARRVSAKTGLTITVANRVDGSVDPEIATVAFRVFQEALTNIVRHAEATRASAVAAATGNRLLLFVRDNGRGLPPEAMRDTHSIGLLGMRERARAVGGNVRITGRRGGGTRVLLHLPLQRP
ncbi:MAG: ATP-binding protein [Vicinamibacterales bacterium]